MTCFRGLLFVLSLAAAGGAGVLAQSPSVPPPSVATDRRLTPLKNLGAFMERMRARPAVQATLKAEGLLK